MTLLVRRKCEVCFSENERKVKVSLSLRKKERGPFPCLEGKRSRCSFRKERKRLSLFFFNKRRARFLGREEKGREGVGDGKSRSLLRKCLFRKEGVSRIRKGRSLSLSFQEGKGRCLLFFGGEGVYLCVCEDGDVSLLFSREGSTFLFLGRERKVSLFSRRERDVCLFFRKGMEGVSLSRNGSGGEEEEGLSY